MDRRVQATIELIENNLNQALAIEELARVAHLSISRLRRVFKKETGMSPAQYLKQLRIRKAKEYLENTFLSIKEIRREIGATDESHFIRDFKKVYGMPPVQLRLRASDAKLSSAAESPTATTKSASR